MFDQVLLDQVQSMYIGYYGRPGDPTGVTYWAGRLQAVGGNLDAIVDAFGTSQEYVERFGSLSDQDMINAFYQQIFNRSADPEGLNFYLGELAGGRMTLATIAKNIWDGAINDDAQIVRNKLAAASYATERVDSENRSYQADDIDAVAAALAKVDATAPGLFAGLNDIDLIIDDLPYLDSQSFTLPDSLTVTEGDAVVLTVELPPYAGTAQVAYRLESGSAAAQQDFAPQQGQLVFAPGETRQTITIQTFDDLLQEPTESFQVVFHDPVGAALPGSASSAQVAVAILDDTPLLEGPTDLEQYYLELVNRARADPAAEAARFGIDLNEGLAGGTLGAEPRQPLAYDPDLTEAARGHAQWLLDTDQFSHTGAGGSSVDDRIEAAGYGDWWTYGENLAWKGSTGGYGDLDSWVADLHRNLFVDEDIPGRGHRLNLLNDSFRESGTGILLGEFSGYDAVMLANDFGALQGASDFLTGVVFDDRDGDVFYTPGEGIGDVLVRVSGVSGNYSTSTTASGGYQLELPGGAYAVEFVAPDGETLDAAIALAGANEKLDWIL